MDLRRSHRQFAGIRPTGAWNASLVPEPHVGASITEGFLSDDELENRRWFSQELDKIFRNFEQRMDAMFEDHRAFTASLLNQVPERIDVHLPRLGLTPSKHRAYPLPFASSIKSADFGSDPPTISPIRSPVLQSDPPLSSTANDLNIRYAHHRLCFLVETAETEEGEKGGAGVDLTQDNGAADDVLAAIEDEEEKEEDEEEVFDEMLTKYPSSLILTTSHHFSDGVLMSSKPKCNTTVTTTPMSTVRIILSSSEDFSKIFNLKDLMHINCLMKCLIVLRLAKKKKILDSGSVRSKKATRNWKKRKWKPNGPLLTRLAITNQSLNGGVALDVAERDKEEMKLDVTHSLGQSYGVKNAFPGGLENKSSHHVNEDNSGSRLDMDHWSEVLLLLKFLLEQSMKCEIYTERSVIRGHNKVSLLTRVLLASKYEETWTLQVEHFSCTQYLLLAKHLVESVSFELFYKYVDLPNFDIASDALATFKSSLIKHKIANFFPRLLKVDEAADSKTSKGIIRNWKKRRWKTILARAACDSPDFYAISKEKHRGKIFLDLYGIQSTKKMLGAWLPTINGFRKLYTDCFSLIMSKSCFYCRRVQIQVNVFQGHVENPQLCKL